MNNKTEITLRKIANMAVLYSTQIKSIGLYDGEMGAAVFLYQYARHSGEQSYSDFADRLLDHVLKTIRPSMSKSFYEGVCGIAIALQYLVREKHIEIDDPDGFFEEIDNKIVMRSDINIDMNIDYTMCKDKYTAFFTPGLYVIWRLLDSRGISRKKYLMAEKMLDAIVKFATTHSRSGSPQHTDGFYCASMLNFLVWLHSLNIYRRRVNVVINQLLGCMTGPFAENDAAIIRQLLCCYCKQGGRPSVGAMRQALGEDACDISYPIRLLANRRIVLKRQAIFRQVLSLS